MVGILHYGLDMIRYEVRFLESRQTLAIEVHPDCRVLVRAPIGCPESLIAERVQKRAAWISRQLAEFERYLPRTPARQYVNGESHHYLGRQYRLKVVSSNAGGVKLTRGQLLVDLPGEPDPESRSDRVKALLHRWYLDRAKRVFSDVLNASLVNFRGAKCPRLIVRTMGSRWGSLSGSGNMTLNVHLVRAPRSCIEYVVTHELCHIERRDHDAQFFKLLSQVMPDWQQRKQRLESALL